MKPRLEAVPLMMEDELIWFLVAVRLDPQRKGRARHWAQQSDRRDAELMHLAQLWRRGEMVMDHTYAHNGPCGRFAIDAKRCGGDL